MSDHAHHVVVVGGGFGGLACVNALKKSGARITLIDQRNHHLFQPLLYQVATTILPTSDIAWPLRRILRHRKDVKTLMAKVVDVDPAQKSVTLDDGQVIAFDSLVLATGAQHSYFGNDQWCATAPGLKTLEDAITIRRRVLSAFEQAEVCDDAEKRRALQTYVIVGGGPTGVELAGIIGDLSQRVLPKEFRNVDTQKTRILLIEGAPRILGSFPQRLSDYAQKALERLGVEVMTDSIVQNCEQDGVTVGETFIPAKTVIWAAGVKASAAGSWIDAATDNANRVEVEPDLSVKEHPDIYVIGDTAAVYDTNGDTVPGIAPAAKQMGKYAAMVITAKIKARRVPKPFRYWHAGNLATIGPGSAVADFGSIRLRGMLAWWVWGLAHIYFLIDTRSRIVVALSWLWSYFSGLNSARLITHHPHASAPSVADGTRDPYRADRE